MLVVLISDRTPSPSSTMVIARRLLWGQHHEFYIIKSTHFLADGNAAQHIRILDLKSSELYSTRRKRERPTNIIQKRRWQKNILNKKRSEMASARSYKQTPIKSVKKSNNKPQNSVNPLECKRAVWIVVWIVEKWKKLSVKNTVGQVSQWPEPT